MSRPPCPYVGLQPFTEAERAFFFGRERDIKLIVANLRVASLTVLYGPSGVGKSSVLRAGVIPALQGLANSAVIYVNDWQSTRSLEALKLACLAAFAQIPGAVNLPAEAAADMSLDVLLLELTDRCRYDAFIILDQFEDCLTYRSPDEVAEACDQELARVVNRNDPCIAVLIAIRADALFRLDRYRTRIPRLLENTLRLRHLDVASAEQAIRQPLAVYNSRYSPSIAVEDALIEAVISDIRAADYSLGDGADRGLERREKSFVEAPLLQLVMTRLWDEEGAAGSTTLRVDTYQHLGSVTAIARTHLDRILSAFSASEQALCATLFDRLVTPSGGTIAQRAADLATYSATGEPEVTTVLTKLTQTRILRTLAPPLEAPEVPRFELFHDVLAPGVLDWRRRFLLEQEKERARREEQERLEEERRLRWKRRLARLYRGGVAALIGLIVLGVLIGLQREVHVMAHWEELNGPPGGAITPLAADPRTPDTIYAAIYGRDGGLYRTDDGGQEWTRLPVGLGEDSAAALAIDPGRPIRLYLATAGGGVLGSADGGATWSPLNDGLFNLNVLDLALLPEHPNVILAVTYGGGGGLYRSRDAGAHWSRVPDVTSQYAYRLATDPDNHRVVVVLTDRGVFRSTDSGVSFALLAEPDVPTDVVHDWAVAADGTTYAISLDGQLSRKSPGGEDWLQLSLLDPDDAALRIWIDERHIGWLYVSVRSALGMHTLLTSRQAGRKESWQDIGADLTRAAIRELLSEPFNPQRLYLGADSGLFRSDDGAQHWTPIGTALARASMRAIAVDPEDPDRIWAGVYGGVFLSADGGRAWAVVNNGLLASDIRTLAVNPGNPQDVFVGVYRPGHPESIFRLVQRASSQIWIGSASGIPNDDTRALLFRSSSTLSLYAGTFGSGVWHTFDGEHWVARNRGLDRLDIVDLAGDANRPETMFAATGGGVYRSDDGGGTWQTFSEGLTDPHIQTIAADQVRSELVYAGTRHGVFVFRQHGPWQAENAGLDRLNVVTLRADPRRAEVVYLATDTGGVFRSINGGWRWKSIAETATSSAVLALEVPSAGRYSVLAGTADAGVLGWARRYMWSATGQ